MANAVRGQRIGSASRQLLYHQSCGTKSGACLCSDRPPRTRSARAKPSAAPVVLGANQARPCWALSSPGSVTSDQRTTNANAGVLADSSESRAFLRFSAALGGVVWLLHRVLADADLISSTLVMGVGVVVPLGLSFWTVRSRESSWFSWLSLLQPVAAGGAIAALTLQPRPASGLFAFPWLVFAVGAFLVGARRLRVRQTADDTPAALALVLLPIGAYWLCLSRAGLDPLGIGGLLVLLTAVHFHFAAFGALLLVACSTRRLAELVKTGSASPTLLQVVKWSTVGIVVGTFLVAAGISGVPVLGVAGAVAIAFGLFAYAVLTLGFVLRHLHSLWSKALLSIAALSILISMPLALAWAWSQWTGTVLVDMSVMLRIHGMANAHGFVLSGLLAWWLQERASRGSAPSVDAE